MKTREVESSLELGCNNFSWKGLEGSCGRVTWGEREGDKMFGQLHEGLVVCQWVTEWICGQWVTEWLGKKRHMTCGVDATHYTDRWNPHSVKWTWQQRVKESSAQYRLFRTV